MLSLLIQNSGGLHSFLIIFCFLYVPLHRQWNHTVTVCGLKCYISSHKLTEANGLAQTNGGSNQGNSDSNAGRGSSQVKGASLVMKQFHALLVKRVHHATRSYKDFLAQVPDLTRLLRDTAMFVGLANVHVLSCFNTDQDLKDAIVRSFQVYSA